jgi:hypothetical protein
MNGEDDHVQQRERGEAGVAQATVTLECDF